VSHPPFANGAQLILASARTFRKNIGMRQRSVGRGAFLNEAIHLGPDCRAATNNISLRECYLHVIVMHHNEEGGLSGLFSGLIGSFAISL
jgi:hypothetical protein